MGNDQSIPKNKIAIGKANVSAPGVLRLFNLEDKVFPYRISEDLGDFPKVHIDIQEAKLESKLSRHLNLSPREHSISSEEEEIYKNVYKREQTASKIIMKGQKVHDVFYDPEEDKNQIYLCRQFLIEINDNICFLRDLRILQACCNYLTRIPRSIGLLSNLKVLILSRNRIRKLPDELGELINLRELNLSHNFLKDLPISMIKLKLLNTLHIDNNRFEKIPQFVVKLSSLKYFNVSHNMITEIPYRLFHLPFLLEFTVDGCPLKFQNSFEKHDNLSLKEICSRRLLRNNLKVYKRIDIPLARYLFSVEECAYCGGPLFDSYYNVTSMHSFDGVEYPIVYKMCDSHYPNHTGRFESLYREKLETFPFRLIVDEMTSVSDLFHMQFFYKPCLLSSYFGLYGKTNLKKLSKYNRLSTVKKVKPIVSANVSDEDE